MSSSQPEAVSNGFVAPFPCLFQVYGNPLLIVRLKMQIRTDEPDSCHSKAAS